MGIVLWKKDKVLLREIASRRYPIVQLELHSTKDASLRSVALPRVRLEEGEETLDSVKDRGASLGRLEEAGFLILHYDGRISRKGEYALYETSRIYAQLCALVEEGKGRPGFLFDTPFIRGGVARITPKGERFLRRLKQVEGCA